MKADRFGTHRVLSPRGCLPQQAETLDASLPIHDNELLIDVEALNIDSSSFLQIKESQGGDLNKIQKFVTDLVGRRGKHHNPVTGSGGMLIGRVKEIGPRFLDGKQPAEKVSVGDRIATLVSLTLTPLEIRKIKKIHLETDRIDIEGHAILFQSGIYSKLPLDISEAEALAILDVAGAPTGVAKMSKPGQTIVVVGGGGKSGVLCLYAAKKVVGSRGKTIALDYTKEAVEQARKLSFVDAAVSCDARNAVQVYETVRELTGGAMADMVVNVTNVPDVEMSCILSVKPKGIVYLYSTATNFNKAALGAEGVGADVQLLIGNGYTPGHAEFALQILRDSSEIRDLYKLRYGTP